MMIIFLHFHDLLIYRWSSSVESWGQQATTVASKTAFTSTLVILSVAVKEPAKKKKRRQFSMHGLEICNTDFQKIYNPTELFDICLDSPPLLCTISFLWPKDDWVAIFRGSGIKEFPIRFLPIELWIFSEFVFSDSVLGPQTSPMTN